MLNRNYSLISHQSYCRKRLSSFLRLGHKRSETTRALMTDNYKALHSNCNMSFNPRCPFHTAVATAAFLGAASYLYFRILKKSTSAIERFDVDARFTNTIKFGELVFISGQIGEGTTIEEQTRTALAEVDKALRAAGTEKSKILEATVWLADIDRDYAGMNKVYDSWIVPGMPPARACIQAKLASSTYLVEVRVIAATSA